MLTRFSIDNFKSLVDFELPGNSANPLPKLVCLVGLNGAGKTTILQALDFLSQLAAGDVAAWLRSRDWEPSDLRTKRSSKSLIKFSVEIRSAFGKLTWSGAYHISEGRCVSEVLTLVPDANFGREIFPQTTSVSLDAGTLTLSSGERIPLVTEHKGSVLANLYSDGVRAQDRLLASFLRHYMSGVKSLELLSPNLMRRPSRDAVDVGSGGEKLAAFVKGLSREEKESLFSNLSQFYPRLRKVYAKSGQFGWNRLFFGEGGGDGFEIEAKHANDGLLRLAAVVAQTVAEGGPAKHYRGKDLNEAQRKELGNFDHKRYQYILLEEIENGINPELIQRLIGYLQQAQQQVFVTTHSPLVLNYLSDSVARESVFFVFKGKNGRVNVRRLFDVEKMTEKLLFMGPGEAYADTSLESLAANLATAE
jgi:ABC-type branched-subunit amino acid transport system ATPase component